MLVAGLEQMFAILIARINAERSQQHYGQLPSAGSYDLHIFRIPIELRRNNLEADCFFVFLLYRRLGC